MNAELVTAGPVVWLLRGGLFLAGALVLAGLAACLLAVFWLIPTLAAQGKEVEKEQPVEELPAAKSGAPEDVSKRHFASSAESAAAADVARSFLLADGVEAKLAFVRFREKIAPLMR